jgi:UDP-GlcNAc:undecaprenyl-phosphate GlcNAc-1-phosphate transferase
MHPGVYAYIALAGAVASLLLVPLFKYLSVRWGVMDVPRPGRIHAQATPLLGGGAVFAALLLVVGGHFAAGYLLAQGNSLRGWVEADTLLRMRGAVGGMPRLLAILAGAVIIVAVGIADDAKSLPIWLRLGAEFAAAGLVVGLGVRPELYILPRWLVYLVAVIWIVGITNSFNLIDSMDGLAAGVAAVAGTIFAFWAGLSNQPMVAMLLAAFVGVMVGFLRFNFNPASIFLGSSGSMLLGYVLGVSVLVTTFMLGNGDGGGRGSLLPILMPLMILGVPLYDTFTVVLIRLYRRRSPFSPDLNHLAHRLHRLGLDRRQTVLFIYLLTFALGVGAVTLCSRPGISQAIEGWVTLLQVLSLFGVLAVLEWVSARSGSARLSSPVAASLALPGGAGPTLQGRISRLSFGGADLDVDTVDWDELGRLLRSREAVRVLVRFGERFSDVRLEAALTGVERSEDGRWRLSLKFGALDDGARRALEFALTHYRALGEG